MMFIRWKLVLVAGLVLALAGLGGCDGGSDDGGGGKRPKPPEPDVFELNNDFDSCTSIVVDPPFAMTDLSLHNQYDEDYYCFNIPGDATLIITVGFTNSKGNIDIQLFNSSRNLLDSSVSSTQDIELIIKNVTAGNHFLRVYGPDGDPNTYSMEIEAQVVSGPLNPDPLESPVPNDDAGSCTSVPNPVDLLPYQAINLTIHDGVDEDWFCFAISQVATLDARIVFFHRHGNLDMQLLDTSLNVVMEAHSQDNDEAISGVLPAGSFLLRVFGVGGETNLYSLELNATAGGGLIPDLFEPNDDPAAVCGGGPADLGTLTGLSSSPTWENTSGVALSLDTIFDKDYYCFNLGTTATVQVDLFFLHIRGNLDVELLDSTLATVGFARSFTDDERLIAYDLPPGDYLVNVVGNASALEYDMKISVFAPDVYDAPPATPNDDATVATFLGNAFPGISALDLTINTSIDEDWFRFVLSPGNDWDVTVDALFLDWIGDLDIEIYVDPGTGSPFQWASTRDDNEQIVSTLPPGNYLLRVFGFVSPGGLPSLGQYDLNIVAVASTSGLTPDRYETPSNNSFVLATPVSSNFDTRPNPLNIHNSADSDYFKFSLNGNQDQEVTIDCLHAIADGDLDLEFYVHAVPNPRIIGRAESATDNEQLVAVVPAGGTRTYYVRVYGFNGDTNIYDLVISTANAQGTPADDNWEPNDDFAAPNRRFLNLDAGGAQTANLSIHNSIDRDYISFSVSQTRSVSIALTNLIVNYDPLSGGNEVNGNDIDMMILDDQMNLIDYAASGDDNEYLTLNVAAGIEYRILIYGYYGAMNTFTFNLTHSAPVPPPPDSFEPNDDCATQARLVPLPLSLPGLSIHDTATDDFYMVRIDRPDTLTARITFTNALGDLDLELLEDDCATQIAIADSSVNSIEEIKENVGVGDYIIRVFAAGASENTYRLDIYTSSGAGGLSPDAYEYNDDQISCTPIPQVWSEPNLSIHTPIDEDFFCFTLVNSSKVKVELRFVHMVGDINGTLWCTANGGITGGGSGSPPCPRIIGSSTTQTDNELIADGTAPFSLTRGDYYIQVQTAANGTNYYEMYVSP